MPIFNFNKKKSPAELVEEGISFARDLFGEHNLYFKQEEYVPPPTSRAPSGMRLVTVSGSKEAAESRDYFKFLIGFHGENPYIYEKETYQQTTPGFLPVNEPAKEAHFKYYPFAPGKNPSVVLNPIQHIFALAAGAVLGNPGEITNYQDVEKMSLERRWSKARTEGAEISSYEGRPVVIGGLPYAIKLGESSARELDDLMAGGPVIGLQNVRKDVFNAEGMAEERTRVDASAGRIPGLPREVYGLDTISKTHRLLRPVSIGLQNEDDTISALTNTPTKAAQIGKRPYNPAMIFTRNKAYDVPESGDYRLQTAVMERGDPVGMQLVMNTLVPTIGGEGSRASGSSHFQAPAGLLKTVRGFGPKAALEATFRSTLDLPIEGLSGPEDLFYTTSEGERKLRINLNPKFTPEGLAKRNVIRSASTFRVAEIVGMRGEHLEKHALVGTTKQRHAAVEGAIFTLPIEWQDDPTQKEFIESTLIPAIQKQGFSQIEFRATEAEKGRRPVSIGLNIRQGEPMALKNFMKVTNTPVSRGAMGLWKRSDSGNLVMESTTDAIVPFKLPEGVVWSRFNVASRAEQKEMLYSIAGEDQTIRESINKYYGSLGKGEPAVLRDIATAVGEKGAIPLLERMTGSILGRERVLRSVNRQGVPVIDERVLAQQNAAYAKYGIGRDYGYTAIGEFTGETKQQFIEGAVRNLIKYSPHKMTAAEAQKIVESAYVFTPGKKLSDDTEIFQGFEMQEVIKARGVAYNPITEVSGVAGEKNDEIAEIMTATGNADIVKFKNMTRREMGGTQAALNDLAEARSSTFRQRGRAGAYIHVGDEETNPERYTMNRQDLLSIVEQLSINNPSSTDLLEGLRKELSNKFGDEFGLEIEGAGQKVYLPKIESIQRLDASTEELITGEESEVRSESLSRLPQKYVGIAQAMAGGSDVDVENAINSFIQTSNIYIKSANLDKTPFGIYSPYETNTLLKPGQLFLSREAQERYYKIMGGDEFDTAQFQKYLGLFTGGAVGVGGRQPYISQKPGDAYGSVAPFEIITEDNPIGRRIAEQQRATGIRSMDLVLSPAQVGMLGDSDADKLSLYMAIGRAQGDQGEFINMLGPMSPEERKAYLQDLLQKQRPEVGEKAMEIMMGGEGPLALEKNPTLANQIGYLLELSGKTEPAGLWSKRPYHNIEDIWEGAVGKASGQKSHAMGDTHNQLIRRLHASGMALKLEPGAYLEAMTSIGTKHSQLAVDQAYESQVLVKMLKGAFIGKSTGRGSAQIVFDKSSSLTGDAEFINLAWNKTSNYDTLVGRIGSILMEKDDLSDTAISRLLGTVSGTTGKRLTEKQSQQRAKKQLRNWQQLEPEITAMRKMGTGARAQRMNELVRQGRVGGNSLLGVALKTRLAEQYEGKLASEDNERMASAEEIRNIAAASGLDINEELLNPTISASRDIYDILKTDKYTDIGYWKDPGNFAAAAVNWANLGMENYPFIQEQMRIWGGIHNLSFQPKEGGGVQVVSGDTGKVINSSESLSEYQAALINRPRPVDTNYVDTSTFEIPGEMQEAKNLAEAKAIRNSFEKTEKDKPTWYLANLLNIPHSPPPSPPPPPPVSPPSSPPPPPPNEPPSDTGETEMPRDRDPGINGSAFYVQEKTPSYAQVEHRARRFSSAFQSFMREGGGYDALTGFGTGERFSNLFGISSNRGTVIERYSDLMARGDQYARTMVPFYLRNNPQTSRALSQLREMKRQAPYLYEMTGNATLEGRLAGALIGKSESTRLLFEEEGGIGKQLIGMMGFLDEPMPRERPHDLPIDSALYLAENRALLRASYAEQENIRINSPYTKSQVALTEADLLKAREARAFNELEEIEIANEIPEEERVTSAYKRLGAGQITEKELAEEVDKRKTSLSKTVGLSDKNLIPQIGKLEAAHDAAAKAQAEYESFGGVSSRVKFESRGIELAELTKLSQAFHDITNGTDSYIKTLNKSTEEMDKFRESVKSGTEEQKKQLEIAEKSRELSKGAIRELIKKAGGADIVSDTEMLTDAEIDYASLNLGKPGQELLEEYKTSRATSSVLEKEIREQGAFPAWTKQLGRAARNIFSGFGLMYMRSMVGMIGGASETGYAESVQYEAALNKAMGTQWGAQKGYNPEADLAGYKALMGGGGKRLINQVIASIYENEPGLIEAGKGIFAGIAGGSSSLWFLNQVAPNFAAAGPVAIAAGATIGIGSYLLNQFGKVTDQTSWLASSGANYLDFERARLNPPSRNPQFTTPSNTIWENLGLMTQSSGRYLAEAYDIAPEWRKEFDENVRLARLQGAAQELVDKSNNTMDLSQAMKKLGYSEEDQFAINKAKALEITAKMMKSVSTEGRVAAAQQLQYFGINPSDNKIDLMNLVGKAYDSGIDYASITEGLLQATGNKYEEDRGRVFEAVASADYTGEEVSRMTSLLEFTTTLGPKWNRQFYGKDISDLVETVTPGGAGVSSIFQKAEQLEKIKYAGQKTEEPLAELFGEFTPEGEKVSSLLEKAEKLYGPVFGENQDLVRQYLATQAEAGLYGIKYEGREIGELPPELLREMTPEEREGRVLADTRYNIGRSAIASWAQKSGRSAIGLQNFWSQLTQTGTLAQQEQYLNVLSNPTPLNFGILVSQLSAEGQAAWNQGTLNVAGVDIPQSALSLTGVDQLTGNVSGRPWGQASLAAPGISAQTMAAKIWGSNWSSSAGAAQPAIDAMVNGFTVGDKTYYGEQGLQAWQNQFSYNQAMAQVGVQLKQIALSEAFTTGKGLSAYGFEEGAGFWSIEDRERELSRRQQEASFENQAWNIRQSEKRLALSEKYYGQNLALTQTQRTMQRAWTQQDWAYQENIRDLQWGWKQEDFQENIRFMTGRERRLAERQMKRDTIMYDLEGERIDDQKERQQSLWKLEDQRFDLDKKQHQETLKMQLEEIAHDKKIFEQSKRFYEEEKKLQDESVRLQRAYYIEQQKLQRESAGIAASAAITQKAVNDAMLDYNDYIQEQKGYLDLAATSFETLQTAIENLIKAIEEGGFNQPTTFTPTQHPGSTNGSQILTIDINGREIARYMLQELR